MPQIRTSHVSVFQRSTISSSTITYSTTRKRKIRIGRSKCRRARGIQEGCKSWISGSDPAGQGGGEEEAKGYRGQEDQEGVKGKGQSENEVCVPGWKLSNTDGAGERRVVIQIQTRLPTPTHRAHDQGQGHLYAQRKLVDTRPPVRDPHLQEDAHEVQPTRNHHHQGVGGVLPIHQLRQETDQGVHPVVPETRLSEHKVGQDSR